MEMVESVPNIPINQGDCQHVLKEKLENLESPEGGVTSDGLRNGRKKETNVVSYTSAGEGRVSLTYQIPHHLARNIAPPNKDAPGAHCGTVFASTIGHQTITTLVRPRHHVSHGLRAFDESIKQRDKLHLEQLKQVLVAAVAHKRRLIAHRLEVNLLP